MDDYRNIYDMSCDCPYDIGAYCKHEAAVLYALREINTKITQSSAKKLNLPQLLEKCSPAQLAEIILEHAKEDKGFGNYLRMRLSETSDTSSIISDFKRISDAYFRGRSDIDDVLGRVNTKIKRRFLSRISAKTRRENAGGLSPGKFSRHSMRKIQPKRCVLGLVSTRPKSRQVAY